MMDLKSFEEIDYDILKNAYVRIQGINQEYTSNKNTLLIESLAAPNIPMNCMKIIGR